jgi:hypothetical protein
LQPLTVHALQASRERITELERQVATAEALSSGQDKLAADEQRTDSTADSQQEDEPGLPDWWKLANIKKRLRSDTPPPVLPDQAAEQRHAGSSMQAWKRLSRVSRSVVCVQLVW